jgi:hypothetical protein
MCGHILIPVTLPPGGTTTITRIWGWVCPGVRTWCWRETSLSLPRSKSRSPRLNHWLYRLRYPGLPIDCTNTSHRRCHRGHWTCSSLTQLWVPEILDGIHTTTRAEKIYFQTIVLYGCRIANRCTTNIFDKIILYNILWRNELCSSEDVLTSTDITSGHEIIILLSAKLGTESLSASEFGLEPSGTFSWAHSCYLKG